MADRAANLRGWLNEPYVQDAVVKLLERADCPMLLREVAVQCDLPIWAANRVLLRLHKKGLVTRYKLPIRRHTYCHRRRACVPGSAHRMLWAYTWCACSPGSDFAG
jgi:hypothetical protein